MPARHQRLTETTDELDAALAAIREELGLTAEFPPDAVAEAEAFAADPRLPEADQTAVEFVTIDPEGSTDLDQALHLERDGDGYLVLTYDEAQRRVDAGDAMLGLLKEVGELRIALEEAREGASLDMPEEQVAPHGDSYVIERRVLLPVERWNAQISLMTGMEAANLQLRAKRGILRTMPQPPRGDVQRFRKEVRAIGEEWAEGEHYGAFLRRLDRAKPTTLAILQAARRLFRGAGYDVLHDGSDASKLEQAAIGAPYAHTTAPLRRLVDRYVLAHCEAIANDREIPRWAADGLEGLPEIMQRSGQLAGKLERESIDAVEIAVLRERIGDEFDAVVVDTRKEGATIQLIDPPTEAQCDTTAEPGERIRVRLTEADLSKRLLRFAQA